MNIGRVCGQVVSTRKAEKLLGFKILVVQPISLDTFAEKGSPYIAIDTVGAGEGEVVITVSGSSSRQTAKTDGKPTDCSIVAIIDSVDVEGKRRFDKLKGLFPDEPKEEPKAAEKKPEAKEPEKPAESEAPPTEEPVKIPTEEPAKQPEAPKEAPPLAEEPAEELNDEPAKAEEIIIEPAEEAPKEPPKKAVKAEPELESRKADAEELKKIISDIQAGVEPPKGSGAKHKK